MKDICEGLLLKLKKIQSFFVTDTGMLNELNETCKIVSHESTLMFKFQLFIEVKSTNQVARVGNNQAQNYITEVLNNKAPHRSVRMRNIQRNI